jgi:hypothetical protein
MPIEANDHHWRITALADWPLGLVRRRMGQVSRPLNCPS